MNSKNSFNNWLAEFLDTLDQEEQENVEKIWKEAKKTDESQNVSVSEKEKDDVFANIASQTGIDTEAKQDKPQTAEIRTLNWRWIAAAAVIIIAAGLSFLTIPVQYSASYGELTTVTLPDESTVTLNSGSSITYNRLFNFTDREVSLEGEAYFEVKNGNLPFKVHTSNAIVKVLGTSFNIRSWQDSKVPETSVLLTEGSLAFYPTKNPDESVILEPGQKSILKNFDGIPEQPFDVSKDKTLAWMNNQFAFENMPLIQIIREIERRFDLDIQVKPQEVLFDTLTIYYNQKVDAEQIVQDICQSKALNYRKINGGFIIENKR
ncbi:FecR family protein [Fodinibius sp.]|uniref:FecR family protein n=1 Tax=Fodinibius sp. TaxID=1872440 RepID=UPI002ACE7E3C|nr:FecR domain-containing protein [Fodinibius sp.]MDZ7660611.1 FecR domain-containing protein [Fodinibius sp.]